MITINKIMVNHFTWRFTSPSPPRPYHLHTKYYASDLNFTGEKEVDCGMLTFASGGDWTCFQRKNPAWHLRMITAVQS